MAVRSPRDHVEDVMNSSVLFLMGAMAILLLGTFTGLVAQTLPVRLAADSRALAVARLEYLFFGCSIFMVGGLCYHWLYRNAAARPQPAVGKLGFWLMFLGFNFAFFPTTLRRSQPMLGDPLDLLAGTFGFDVSFGLAAFAAGVILCLWDYLGLSRSLHT